MKHVAVVAVVAVFVAVAAACEGRPVAGGPVAGGPRQAYAIAIHGGAGTIPRTMDAEQVAAYEASLRRALTLGRDRLAEGKSALDVCEAVIRDLEDDPLFNAGKGAVFTYDGTHELDASIMDGATMACGAVAGVKTVKNPISLARKVMEQTKHVLLVGEGAEAFATEMKVERVENSWFDTDKRRQQWQEAQAKEGIKGTVGCVALDRAGHLAAGTSTGGLTNKRWGRVGDSPIIGAGTYASDTTVAVSCTGTGEEFIRYGVARTVATRMALAGDDVEQAARAALSPLKKGDGGLIAVDRRGKIALTFNTDGMYRGAADASGRFDVAIW